MNMEIAKQKLKQFIDSNFNEFSNLGKSEVTEISAEEFDTDVINYLKTCIENRFDYEDICIYYVDRKIGKTTNEIWVENMNS